MERARRIKLRLSAWEADVQSLTLCPHGVGEGGRTLDIDLGKVALYH